MNTLAARMNMVKQQVRAWNMFNEDILALLVSTSRELFVPKAYQSAAFADMNIPLGHEQVMMSPCVEARMLEALQLNSEDKVLEVGTGSAYITALLAKACQHVYSVDIFSEFTEAAKSKLAKQQIDNVTLQTGDASAGWENQQPYDVICITGSTPLLDDNFRQQLSIGGRLFVVLGEGPAMKASLITRSGDNEWREEHLFETNLPPLVNAKESKQFLF